MTVVLTDDHGNRWTGTLHDGEAAGVDLRVSPVLLRPERKPR